MVPAPLPGGRAVVKGACVTAACVGAHIGGPIPPIALGMTTTYIPYSEWSSPALGRSHARSDLAPPTNPLIQSCRGDCYAPLRPSGRPIRVDGVPPMR
jgi:hypothetical protein